MDAVLIIIKQSKRREETTGSHIPCVFTVNSAFVAINVALRQDLVTNSTCDKLAHQLQGKHNRW